MSGMATAAAPQDRSRVGLLALRAMQVVSVAWLGAFIEPLADLRTGHVPLPQLVMTLVGVMVFIATYLWVSWSVTRTLPAAAAGPNWSVTVWLPVAILTALSVAFSLGYGGSWLELFIFSGVSAGFRLPTIQAVWTVVGLVLLGIVSALVSVLISGPPAGQSGGISDLVRLGLLIGSPGFAILTVVYSVRTVRELRAARAEIARLAVADERLRFARDLHDLLGRSLSLIALKSELAGQLVPAAPERAVAEIRDVEQVARTALQEVRDAVAGYRQPTLDGELRAAREILAAAGIGFSHDDAPVALPSTVEAVLAWAVREGVTNVIRHSRARYCSIRLQVSGAEAELTISDDGRGNRAIPPSTSPANGRGSGHGLAGLAERVAALGGALRAGPQAGGGFRLTVALPLAAEAGAEPTLLAATPQYESQRP